MRKQKLMLRQLLEGMDECFSLEELDELCFFLGISYDNIRGDTKKAKIRGLINYMDRREQLDELLRLVQEKRPDWDWPNNLQNLKMGKSVDGANTSKEGKSDYQKNIFRRKPILIWLSFFVIFCFLCAVFIPFMILSNIFDSLRPTEIAEEIGTPQVNNTPSDPSSLPELTVPIPTDSPLLIPTSTIANLEIQIPAPTSTIISLPNPNELPQITVTPQSTNEGPLISENTQVSPTPTISPTLPIPKRLSYDGIKASRWWVPYYPYEVYDRNLNSYWGIGNENSVGQWIKFLFRNPKIITEIGIYRNGSVSGHGQIIEATLTFSDGSQQAIELRGLNEWEYVDIAPVETDSVVLTVDKVSPNRSLILYEMELIGYSLQEELSESAETANNDLKRLEHDGISASTAWIPYYSRNAYDRNTNSIWSVGNNKNSIGQWIQLLFREPLTVSRVGLYRASNLSDGQIIEAILTFSDGSEQTIMFRGFNGWEYVDIEPVSTDSIKLTVIKVSPNRTLAVYELEFLGSE